MMPSKLLGISVIRRLRFTVSLFKMMAQFDGGNYLSAYRTADRMTENLCPKNLRILLFKVYLMVLLGNEPSARRDLQEFYNIVVSQSEVLNQSNIDDEDRKWIFLFANYLISVLGMEKEYIFYKDYSEMSCNLSSINFSRMSDLTKKMFPPQHLLDMKKYML